MHMDPLLPVLVGAGLAILFLALVMRSLGQPHVVAYLLAGIILGPHGVGVVEDHTVLERLGDLGVILLLFFVGMEMDPRRLSAQWRIALIGTLLQIIISVGFAWLVGWFFDWPLARKVLIGFVISLSSTAVVLSLLHHRGELESRVGQNVLAILLIQDLAVIPMMLVIGMFGDDHVSDGEWIRQGIGVLLVGALCLWMFARESIRLPWVGRLAAGDHELQVFLAFIFCFGLALITGLLSLSTALGAFVAGMLVASARETEWIHHSLEPFRVIFVALFFVSIGMLVDLHFLWLHPVQIGSLVFATFISNTFINAAILRLLGEPWQESLYAGALLAQIGEFSFVLVAVGYGSGIISIEGYHMAIAVIALTLILAPLWPLGMRVIPARWFSRNRSG